MYKVMLVDDEPWALKGLASLIGRLDSRYEVAGMYESPVKAVSEAGDAVFDVLFTDIRMPEMSGIELIRAFRSTRTDFEAVIISAHRSFEAARDAMALDVRQYLLKPYSREDVRAVLDRIALRIEDRRSLSSSRHSAHPTHSDGRPFGCMLAADADTVPPTLPGVRSTPYRHASETGFWFCTLESREAHERLASVAREAGCGLSALLANARPTAAMMEEARMSQEGGFIFSEHEHVAEAQRHLYRLHGQRVDVKGISEKMYLSQGYLSNLFKRKTGMTMCEFCHEARIHRAACLLDTSGLTLGQISERVGYEDYNYFARLFRRTRGVSPESYRNGGRRREAPVG